MRFSEIIWIFFNLILVGCFKGGRFSAKIRKQLVGSKGSYNNCAAISLAALGNIRWKKPAISPGPQLRAKGNPRDIINEKILPSNRYWNELDKSKTELIIVFSLKAQLMAESINNDNSKFFTHSEQINPKQRHDEIVLNVIKFDLRV